MTAHEWRNKLWIAINEYWKLENKLPKAIYMGHKEDMDYRSNVSPGDIDYRDDRMYFQGVEIIRVHRGEYFRVI